MRIVGGQWRGIRIEAPSGRDHTRPTTDRNREAIASSIMSACGLSLEGCSVLDVFAGSGAMGLELLSRGAKRCTFVESHRPTAALIRANCQAVGATKATEVLCRDAFSLPECTQLTGAPFDIVFLDPPYMLAASDVAYLVDSLVEHAYIAPGALVVYERATTGEQLACKKARIVRVKKYKTTSVDLMRVGEEPTDASL